MSDDDENAAENEKQKSAMLQMMTMGRNFRVPTDIEKLKDDELLEKVGEVLSIQRIGPREETIVTIRGIRERSALDSGTVLCLADKSCIGIVDEIFGPVAQPHYTIWYPNNTQIPHQLQLDVAIFYPVSVALYVAPIPILLKEAPPCDASWKDDEEIPLHLQDHSDDEAEMMAKRGKKRSRNLTPSASTRYRSCDQSNAVHPSSDTADSTLPSPFVSHSLPESTSLSIDLSTQNLTPFFAPQ